MALVLLNLSAAFDTVDRGILLDMLFSRFGDTDRVFEWFQSYLTGWTQVFCTGSDHSEVTLIACSVPQGSIAGPLLFIDYTKDLEDTISSFTFNHHMYADDMQLLAHMSLQDVQYVRSVLKRCILAIQDWCSSRRLQLNLDKTEVIWFGSKNNLMKLQKENIALKIGSVGVLVDNELTMWPYIYKISSAYFCHLRRLWQLRCLVDRAMMKSSLYVCYFETGLL